MTENRGLKIGDIVQKEGSSDQYIVISFEHFYGRYCWRGISPSETGNGYMTVSFDDWNVSVVGHADPKTLQIILNS